MGCVVPILKVKVISAVERKGLACEIRYMVGMVVLVGICWNGGVGGYIVEWWVYGVVNR